MVQFGKCGRYELCIGEYMSIFDHIFKILNLKCIYQVSRGYRRDTESPKQGPRYGSMAPKTTKNHKSKQGLQSDLLHSLSF